MPTQKNNSRKEIEDYFERFKRIGSVQEKSRQLEDTCKALEPFRDKIEKAAEDGGDLSRSEKQTLKSLTDRYSALMKELNDEFQKFPF